MEDREEALDFIYKGWREGRQQRRNLVRQRGLDRTRAMLEPILAQRARGSMASMPPSMPIMPVEETTPVVPEEPPSMERVVAETVSSPPQPADDMTNDITDPSDHPDDAAGAGAFPAPHNNFQHGNPEARAAAGFPSEETTAALPSPSSISRRPVKPSPVSRPSQYVGPEAEAERLERDKQEAAQIEEEHQRRVSEWEAGQDGSSTAREQQIEELKAKEAQRPVKEEEKLPEHEAAFEPAFNEMVEEATTPKEAKVEKPVETNKPKKKATKKKASETTTKKPKSAKAVVEQTKKTPDPKPAKAVVEATKPKSNVDFMDSTEGEDPKAPYVKIGDKYVSQATASRMVREGTHKWGSRGRDGRATLQEVGSKKKTTAKKTTTKKPAKANDPVVQAAAKKNKEAKKPTAKKTTDKKTPKSTDKKPKPIKPEGKASNEGKERAKRASDELAGFGMGDSPPPKKKTDEKGDRKPQDLRGIKKPDKSDLRRSADQQMLADVLLKKLPVADLRMINTMLGGDVELPVLVDEMGFPTQGIAVDPAHIMMAGISDNPNPFEAEMDPRLRLDLNRLKISQNVPSRLPMLEGERTGKKMIAAMTEVPTKLIPKLDDDGKKIPTTARRKLQSYHDTLHGKKNKFGNPTYEMEPVDDEEMGWFIQDGNKKRRMTEKEAKDIYENRPRKKGLGSIDVASPYWEPTQFNQLGDPTEGVWNLPFTEGKNPKTLPKVFMMGQTTVGATPLHNQKYLDDPRKSTYSKTDWSKLKEVASISPADFKRIISDESKKPKEQYQTNGLVRIGDSAFDLEYLKQIASSFDSRQMANEDFVLTGMENAPLFIAGRGVKRYDEEPSYFETILAPRIDNEHDWQSMNDLFE